MTLAIGQQTKRQPRCAFTLVELILVLALLVVAVSIVSPRISGFIRGRALDSEARRLIALAHAGGARAVSEGMPTVLWLDEKNSSYGLELETPGANGDEKAEAFTADENVRLAAESSGVNGLTKFKELPAIRFLADGSVDENSPQTVRLYDAGGGALWLVETEDRSGYEIRNSNK
jgi:prepilin-type N-terminal cleavage/methylation domain-containing protein